MKHYPHSLQRVARALLASLRSIDRRFAERSFHSASIDIRPLLELEFEQVMRALPQGCLNDADLVEHRSQLTTILVAWLDTKPVGIGWMHWDGPRDAALMDSLGRVPEIHRLHVNKRYRSFGLGSRIISSFELLAIERGLARIGLGVHVRNHRATALYQRLGFLKTGERYLDEFAVQEPNGMAYQVREPSIYMIRDITVSNRTTSGQRARPPTEVRSATMPATMRESNWST